MVLEESRTVTVPSSPGPEVVTASRALAESLPGGGVLVLDQDLRIIYAEGNLFLRVGVDVRAVEGRLLEDWAGPERWSDLAPYYAAALAGEPQSFDQWTPDGAIYWIEITPVLHPAGDVTSLLAVFQDVTDRARAADALARSEARLREAERMVGIGSFERDLVTKRLTYSEGFLRLMGLSSEDEVDVRAYASMIHPQDRPRVDEAASTLVEAGGSATCEYRIVRADGVVRTHLVQGEIVPDALGRATVPPCHRATVLRGAALDVTEQREAEHARLEAASLFRRGFDEAPIGMVMVEPDEGRFMEVNDAMCRLLGRSRAELVGTPVYDVTHPDDQSRLLEGRQELIDDPSMSYQTEKRYVRPDGSIVWASLHATPVTRPDGSRRAIFAQVFDITERKDREARHALHATDMAWLGRVRSAIDADRLVLYTQPIIDLASGEPVQHELLLRMVDDDGSVLPPSDFLPVAERLGMMTEIDCWVIRQAMAMAAGGIPAQFNLSGLSIGDPAILAELEESIGRSGVDPSLLVVEVTETAIMELPESSRAFMDRVTALGCGVALDDFGTGFSGLGYLKRLPAQQLKIDIEYVQDATRSEDGERMIRGIVGLAREFDMTTTAEGVEDEATLAPMRDLGVDRAQGYLFGRPQPLR
jgi:PAS domain S-box-containing protein